MNRDTMDANKIIAGILRAGSTMSAVLMAVGLGLYLLGGNDVRTAHPVRILGFRQALMGMLSLKPVALMTMGILALLLTPFMRVAGAFFTFLLVEKDSKYALISLVVLLILVAAMFMPGFK